MSHEFSHKAYKFAHKAHEGQFRRDGVTPYFKHCEDVYSLVMKLDYFFADNIGVDRHIIYSIALLHDVIEDTDYTHEDLEREFTKEIADAVQTLSRLESESKVEYLERVLSVDSRLIKTIKLCDRLANLRDMDNLEDTKSNLKFIKRYLENTKDYFLKVLDPSMKYYDDLLMEWGRLYVKYI